MGISKNGKNRLLYKALAFAGRAHDGQVRRDEKTPYVTHVFGVALTLIYVFGVKDPEMLTAAVLHDTLEDTDTSTKKLRKKFGAKITFWVELLSKDKRKPVKERERIYRAQLLKSPSKVKVIKLADIYDNLIHSKSIGAQSFNTFRKKAKTYVNVLAIDRSQQLLKPLAIVNQLIG